jgi:hypothetical protein
VSVAKGPLNCRLGRHEWVWLGGDMSGTKRCARCGRWDVISWLLDTRYALEQRYEPPPPAHPPEKAY